MEDQIDKRSGRLVIINRKQRHMEEGGAVLAAVSLVVHGVELKHTFHGSLQLVFQFSFRCLQT